MNRMNVGTRIGLVLIVAAALLFVVLAAKSVEVEGQGTPDFTMSITGNDPVILDQKISQNNTTFEISSKSTHTMEIEWWYHNISGIDIHPEPSSVVLGPGKSISIDLNFQLNGSKKKGKMAFTVFGKVVRVDGVAVSEGSESEAGLFIITYMDYFVDASAPSGGDGSCDNPYNKIQDAIDNATEGDTIRVWEGTYEENVVVNKTVNLVGNGSEVTVIDGGGSGDVVQIKANWVNMSGFGVTGSKSYRAGIKVESDNIYIFKNNCSNNYNGISLRSSSACKITNNTMNENGIIIEGYSLEKWNSHTIETTNTVNGKPVYYYKNVTDFIVPYGAGQVILANCSQIQVENQNVSNASIGISIGYSSHIIIENNTCSSNSYDGIRLWNSIYCLIINNTCNLNSGYGIYLEDNGESSRSYCKIINNTCENNRYGIHLWYSRYCTITNNTCSSNNNYGIFLWYSSNCPITNNTCSSNNYNGIQLWDSDYCPITNNICENNRYGIFLLDSGDSTLENNTCSNNEDGIYLHASRSCLITNNAVSENRVGIFLGSRSSSNPVHYNKIYNNTDYGIDATENEDYTINATYNWWGAASGPYHPTKNPEGKGDNITDNIEFDPWFADPGFEEEWKWPPEAYIDYISPDTALLDTSNIHFKGKHFKGPGTDDGTISRYVWRSSIDNEFYNGTESDFYFNNLSLGEHTIYFRVQDNYGVWSSEATGHIEIYDSVYTRPLLDITSDDIGSKVNGTVNFTGTTSLGFSTYWSPYGNYDFMHTIQATDWSDLSVSSTDIILRDTNRTRMSLEDIYGLNLCDPSVCFSYQDNDRDRKISVGDNLLMKSVDNGGLVDDAYQFDIVSNNILWVEISFNNGTWFNATGTEGWYYEWDTTQVKNGDYTIRVRAFDGTNYSEVKEITVTVENENDGGGGGFIPGFEAVSIISGIGVALTLTFKKRKQED